MIVAGDANGWAPVNDGHAVYLENLEKDHTLCEFVRICGLSPVHGRGRTQYATTFWRIHLTGSCVDYIWTCANGLAKLADAEVLSNTDSSDHYPVAAAFRKLKKRLKEGFRHDRRKLIDERIRIAKLVNVRLKSEIGLGKRDHPRIWMSTQS